MKLLLPHKLKHTCLLVKVCAAEGKKKKSIILDRDEEVVLCVLLTQMLCKSTQMFFNRVQSPKPTQTRLPSCHSDLFSSRGPLNIVTSCFQIKQF